METSLEDLFRRNYLDKLSTNMVGQTPEPAVPKEIRGIFAPLDFVTKISRPWFESYPRLTGYMAYILSALILLPLPTVYSRFKNNNQVWFYALENQIQQFSGT